MKLRKIGEGIIFGSENPKEGDVSGYMPFICEMDDGTLLVPHSIGSRFDGPDCDTYIVESRDGGRTFRKHDRPVMDTSDREYPVPVSCKVTNAGGGHVLAVGYGFVRNKGEAGPANPETNGLLDCPIFFAESFDGGVSFSRPVEVDTAWGPHCEASAPLLILPNGDYVTPTAAMPDWEGGYRSPMCGRLLRSCDGGRTWNDDTVVMDFGPDVSAWEQRICRTESGKLVVIGWNENLRTGELMNNHVAISEDNGRSFGAPIDTGIHGQASGVCAIGGDRILTTHAMRRDVDRVGVMATIVNLADGGWDVEYRELIWEPSFVMTKTTGNLEVFSALRFGQPSAVLLKDGTVMYTQWLMENEVCRTIWQRYELVD